MYSIGCTCTTLTTKKRDSGKEAATRSNERPVIQWVGVWVGVWVVIQWAKIPGPSSQAEIYVIMNTFFL